MYVISLSLSLSLCVCVSFTPILPEQGNGRGPVSRDRHTTTLISRPSAPCVDCGHGEPIPVTPEYRWLDTGGFHSGSPIGSARVYGYGVHELRHAPGAANPWTWAPVWPE